MSLAGLVGQANSPMRYIQVAAIRPAASLPESCAYGAAAAIRRTASMMSSGDVPMFSRAKPPP